MARIRVRSRIPLWVAAALALVIVAVACGTDPPPPPVPVTWDMVQNSSVPGDTVGEERVTLTEGHYSVLTGDVANAIDMSLLPLHAAGDLDGNGVQDEVGIMVSTAGEQLRTESVVGFLAAPGAPAATAAYPLPAGYRVDGLSVDEDGVGVTYAAPRLQDTAYDEVRGRLVLRLRDDGFVEVGHTEQAVPMPAPEQLGVEAGESVERTGEVAYGWRARFAQSAAADERLEIELTSAWGAASLAVFAPDGSALLAPEAGGASYVVEKAVPGDYLIHVIGGGANPVPYTINVSRASAPPPPAPSGRTGLPPVPDPGQNVVYLTFDDGPDPRYTPKILDALRRYDARATFFVVGSSLEGHRDIAEQIVAEGSTIGNHTWNHGSLQGISRAEFRSVVGRTQELMGSLGSACLRPPYGKVDANTETYAREMGLTLWRWTIDTVDYLRPSPDTIVERAAAAGPGSIVLMHDGGGDRSSTVAALPKILERLKSQGYRFEPLCR